MVVIWGLDLKEMQWRKFKGSYMWGRTYHHRRRRFIAYQLAMILCVVSESLGTKVLSGYAHQQGNLEATTGVDSPPTVINNKIVNTFAYNIFVGVYVAIIFGSAFFFDLFWPERREVSGVRIAWRICSVLACCFTLSSALLLTVTLVTHRAVLVGPAGNVELEPPLVSRNKGEAIASLVLVWTGWLATCWSTYLMWSCISHRERYGPFSEHARAGDTEEAKIRDAGATTGA